MFVGLAEQASSLSERRRRHRMIGNDHTGLRNELVYSNGILKFFPADSNAIVRSQSIESRRVGDSQRSREPQCGGVPRDRYAIR